MILPVRVDDSSVFGFHYEYPSLEVIKMDGKGDGVIARELIPKYSVLPYIGVLAPTRDNFYSLLQTLTLSKYTIRGQIGLPVRSRRNVTLSPLDVDLDGDPSINSWINRNGCEIGLRGLAIGAKINEPSEHEHANCVFTEYNSVQEYSLPWTGSMGLLVIQDVFPGHELTVCYGSAFARTGYEHLVSSLCAKQSVLSDEAIYGISTSLDRNKEFVKRYLEKSFLVN